MKKSKEEIKEDIKEEVLNDFKFEHLHDLEDIYMPSPRDVEKCLKNIKQCEKQSYEGKKCYIWVPSEKKKPRGSPDASIKKKEKKTNVKKRFCYKGRQYYINGMILSWFLGTTYEDLKGEIKIYLK